MGALKSWIANNLLYSEIIALTLVIIGAGLAMKAGKALGWLILAGGVAFGLYALYLKGLL
jgi:hypothetical protein